MGKNDNTCSWRISIAIKQRTCNTCNRKCEGNGNRQTDYKYLEVFINRRCKKQAKIDDRLTENNKCFGALFGIIKSKHLLGAVKKRKHKTIIYLDLHCYTVVKHRHSLKRNKIKFKYWRGTLIKNYEGKKAEEGCNG